ncbi:MAG: hypothetical protein U0Q18_02810 [Bryobacteraceae bacterium]
MISALHAVLALFAATAPASDPKAIEIAQAMMQAMGGQDAWNKAHYVRFDFTAIMRGNAMMSRSHLWDKRTGRYRFEDHAQNGTPAVVLFNVGTQQGVAYVGGKRMEGAAESKAVQGAYGAFINDMYWLAMPWKWLDPGVHLKYLGQKERAGKKYDVVQLTFDKVGLTPGDRYEAYVSPSSHLMEHWDYVLQGGQKGSWDWEYTTSGGVKLASNHVNADGNTITMGDVRILDKVADGFFSEASQALASLPK